MKRRYAVYVVVIALLGAANLARLWTNFDEDAERPPVRKAFLPEDFRLRNGNPAASESRRNLFLLSGDASRTATSDAHRVPTKAMAQPPAKHEPSEAAAADALIDKVKLLGVVFRAGKAQAYLGLEKESVIARAGDIVLERFIVDKIDVEAVELRDMKDNTTRRVPVSGK